MRALAAVCLLSLTCLPAGAGQAWQFNEVERVVAFGDVHGAFDELVSVLQAAAVIDDRLQWSGGTDTLVSVGDLLDRGDDSRRVMDLLMRLEREASEAGGRVHVVLGNHETLNLVGDPRYVSDGEYAAFADDEDPAQRAAALADFVRRAADPVVATAEFAELFPPGFFGHRAAFRPDGKYGRWLLTLPVMLKIDNTVYVHGGLPPLVAELGLDRINDDLRRDLADFVSLWHDLQSEGLVAFEQSADLAAIEWAKLLESETPPVLSEASRSKIERFVALSESPVFSGYGPLWYRGSALCHPLLETDVIDVALERLGVDRVVAGHTPTRQRRAVTRLDDKVVLIDTGMLADYYNGTPVALAIERGVPSVVYPELPGIGQLQKADHDNAADWAGDLADLEGFLRTTPIVESSGDKNRQVATLRADDGREARAMVIGRRSARRELAAYALDRLLGLGIVPVTVPRTIDNNAVALRLQRDDWIDEPTRIARQLPIPVWCAAGDNFELMSVFDALTANDRSDPATIWYSSDRERIWVTDFASAFDTGLKLPRYLEANQASLEMAGEIARRLHALDDTQLEAVLGDLLNKRERRALLQRRNAILSNWTIRKP